MVRGDFTQLYLIGHQSYTVKGRKKSVSKIKEDVENACVATGEEGEGGRNWEIRFDVNTLPCVKQMASGKLRYSTGSSARCSVMT